MGLASKLQAAQAGGVGGASAPAGAQPSAPPFPGGAPGGAPGGYGAPSQGPPPYGGPQNGSGPPLGQYGSGYLQQPPYGGPNQQQPPYGGPNQQQPPYGGPGQQQPPYGAGPQQSPYGGPNQQQPPYGGGGQQQPPYGSSGQQPGQYGSPSPYGAPAQGAPGQYGQPGSFPTQYSGGQLGGFGASGSQPLARPGIGAGPGGVGSFDSATIRNKLVQMIQTNTLQAFYPPPALEQVVQRVASTDLNSFGARWRLPKEITLDVVVLGLYQIVLYCDDSGSMAFEEGGERIRDLKEILSRTADAATLFDPSGISVRFMNSPVEGNNLRTAAEVENLVGQVHFSGMTPLGTGLDRKVIQPLVISRARANQLQKPVLVIVITDGEPTGESRDAMHSVIVQAKRYFESTQYGPDAVAFQFAQVGNDPAAEAYLQALDTDPVIGKHVDCVSNYELESEAFRRKGIDLTPELWLVKLLVGAIDPTYDEQDE